MLLKTKLRRKRAVVLVLFILCMILLANMGRFGNGEGSLAMLGANIPMNSVKGVINTQILILCVGMVLVEYKLGYIMALVVMGLTVFSSARATLLSPNHESVPGVINALAFIIITTVIFRQVIVLKKESHTDFITNLYNRRGMAVQIAEAIEKKKPFDLVSIEIKEFDLIGDELGFECSDDVIREIGNRIRAILGDDAIISHFDMTNFCFMLPVTGDTIKIVSDVIKSITQRITVKKNGMDVNCHIFAYAGISSFPKDADNIDDLIKYSNISMHHCSKHMKHFLEVFDESIKTQYLRDAYVESSIKEALDVGSIYMVHQPQFDATTKKLVGFEVLSRLMGTDGEIIPAEEFITNAERTDLIIFVDYFMLKKAIWQFSNVFNSMDSDIIVSVNLSAKTISSVGIVDYILATVKEANFPIEQLEIEITEYSFAIMPDVVEENIKALSSFGIKIAIDDFGSGYTSLSHISKLPIDYMKVDKSIVDDIEIDTLKKDIVDSVIYIGHLMKCKVVCEGVERAGQVDILKALDCDIIQGFTWGRPMLFDDVKKLIEEEADNETTE